MREIKFRAWDKENRKWDYFNLNNVGFYAKQLNEHLLCGHEFYLFTGLYDRNKKEIWEGDQWMWRSDGGIYIVKWFSDVGAFGFSFTNNEGQEDFYDLSLSELGEVIGNIYSNPEGR